MRRALWCVLACVAAGRSPAPFNATRWFGGECGTKRAGVTVVETLCLMKPALMAFRV